jgi:hypothetical protein
MPDFTVRFTHGVQSVVWDDHAGAGSSRINPHPARPSKYHRAAVGAEVRIEATWDGLQGPDDSQLGGKLFSSDFAEVPFVGTLVPNGMTGQSSVQRFTPPVKGHYLWVMRHEDGGAVGVHLDVE